MMKTSKTLTQAALIAALYFVLSLLQDLLIPSSGSMMIQFRVAEALCVLALFSPAAIYGLTLGCLLYNFTHAGSLPLDFLIGAGATFFSTCVMYTVRNIRLWKLPLLAFLMPAAFNGLLVGWELTVYFGRSPFWINCLWVSLGELAVLFTLGILLYFVLSRKNLHQKLLGR